MWECLFSFHPETQSVWRISHNEFLRRRINSQSAFTRRHSLSLNTPFWWEEIRACVHLRVGSSGVLYEGYLCLRGTQISTSRYWTELRGACVCKKIKKDSVWLSVRVVCKSVHVSAFYWGIRFHFTWYCKKSQDDRTGLRSFEVSVRSAQLTAHL